MGRHELPDQGPGPEYSEGVRLRMSDADAADARSRASASTSAIGGAITRLVQTTTVATYPTTAAAYFACTPLDVLGTQTEGSPGSTTTCTGLIYVFNLGTAIPPNGTKLVATFVPYRWVTRYDG
jgi:hypothetical protein